MGWAKTDPKIKLNLRTENLGQKSRSKISVKKISVKNLGRDRDRDFTTETFQLDRNYASRPDINRSRPRLGHLGRARPNLGRDLNHLGLVWPRSVHLGPRRCLLRSFAPLARFLTSLARFLAFSVHVARSNASTSRLDPHIRRCSSKMCQITYKATNSVCRHLFLQSRTKQA